MNDTDFMKMPVPTPTLQLKTATPEDLAQLRIRFPEGSDYAQIGDYDHGH